MKCVLELKISPYQVAKIRNQGRSEHQPSAVEPRLPSPLHLVPWLSPVSEPHHRFDRHDDLVEGHHTSWERLLDAWNEYKERLASSTSKLTQTEKP